MGELEKETLRKLKNLDVAESVIKAKNSILSQFCTGYDKHTDDMLLLIDVKRDIVIQDYLIKYGQA